MAATTFASQRKCARVAICSFIAIVGICLYHVGDVMTAALQPSAPPRALGAATADSRRSLIAGMTAGVVGWSALPSRPVEAASFSTEAMFDRELPPLPKAYHDAVIEVATVVKQALVETVKANREEYSKATAQRLQQAEVQVAKAVKRYEKDYLDQAAASKLDAMVLEHPVYYTMRQAIARLRNGGQEVDPGQSLLDFRMDLVRQLSSVVQFAEKAGVAPV